jgi:integrase
VRRWPAHSSRAPPGEEADRLANSCRSAEAKLIAWTLLDTGLRVSELCALTLDHVQWQQRALRVTGKAGPHGSRHKQRIVPLSARVRAILEPYAPGSQLVNRFGKYTLNLARTSPVPDYTLSPRPASRPVLASASL